MGGIIRDTMGERGDRTRTTTAAAVAPPAAPVTRASTCKNAVADARPPSGPPRPRFLVPARIRIMTWLVLLLFVALATVVVVTRPRVLLLDEADAHLDRHAAGAVDRLLSTFRGAVVLVSHRPARLPSATARPYKTLSYELRAGTLRLAEHPRG